MFEESDNDVLQTDWFKEPEEFRKPENPHTFQKIQLENGQEFDLRLVGSSPLWGHYLWNGARAVSSYLLDHASSLIEEKRILELGAGAGLPSLVCASHGARHVITTDYPDADLIENLEYNIGNCASLPVPRNIFAKGYLWGAAMANLNSESESIPNEGENQFDTVILADLLFNHSEHSKLMNTVKLTLARTADARALVFFTPYRPWLLENDLSFFKLASATNRAIETDSQGARLTQSLTVQKIGEEVLEKVMFEDDRGDELLRRTVFGYAMMWSDLQ